MKFFAHILLGMLIISLTSCVKSKEELEEKSEVEFESNVMVGKEDSELRIGDGNIYQTVGDNESLAILHNALRATGLDSVLSQDGPYTLFAPSDNAIDELTPNYADAVPGSVEREELKNILMHHVVKGSYSDTEIAGMEELEPLYGEPLQVIKVDGTITLDSAALIFSDREADNGYVHVVDEVLFPE